MEYVSQILNERIKMENNTHSQFAPREEKDIYDVIANDLINDLGHIQDPDNWKYFHEEKEYSIHDYYTELKERTAVGMEWVIDFYRGIKFGLVA